MQHTQPYSTLVEAHSETVDFIKSINRDKLPGLKSHCFNIEEDVDLQIIYRE
jgi:hypothetical protein